MILNPWDVQSKHIHTVDGISSPLYSGECRYGGGEMYLMQDVYGFDPYNQVIHQEVSPTVKASQGIANSGGGVLIVFGLDSYNQAIYKDVSCTIKTACGGDTIPKVAVMYNETDSDT